MPKVKEKLTREEKLKNKREAQRKRYQKIKNDPAAYEKQKEKERQKYLKKKMKGIIKPIAEMTAREKRSKRKQWKTNSRNYRKRSSVSQHQPLTVEEISTNDNSEQLSTSSMSNLLNSPFSDSRSNNAVIESRKLSGQKRVMRNRSALHRKCVKMENQIKCLIRKLEKYKKRNQRLNLKINSKLEDMTQR